MASMEPAAHLAALRREGEALLGAARAGTLSAGVPACPDWDVAALVGHTSAIHRWAATIARGGTVEEARAVRRSSPGDADLLDWYAEGLDLVLSTLEGADMDVPVWSWAGGRQPVAFWARRMALETAVHRWDVESAGGAPRPVDAALAVDGVDEMLDVFVAAGRVGDLSGAGETLHLHSTDATGEWLIRFGEEGVHTSRQHAKGDCAIRAAASDLFLLLWGRRDGRGLDVFGDPAVLRLWTGRVRI